MGVIFPLSWGGRVILILIAIVLAAIYFMMKYPIQARKIAGKIFGRRELLKKTDEENEEKE